MNRELNEFMPEMIAASHDKFIVNYLNGFRVRPEDRPSIKTVMRPITSNNLISNGRNSKSIVVIPRLEFLYSDDIYIAGLIVPRKKNNYPIIYTDLTGNIVGSNSLVSD